MATQFLDGRSATQAAEDEPTRRQRTRDFVERYERGAYDQLGDEEVVQTYRVATTQLSPEEFQRVAAEAFGRMSPEERRELLGELQRRSQGRLEATDDSPEAVARTVHRAEQETQGGGLAGLFGFGGTEAAERQPQEGSLPGMFDNPIVKIGIAGIAALAAKLLLSPDREGGHHAREHH